MRNPSLVFTRRIHTLHYLSTKTPTGTFLALPKQELPQIENEVHIRDRQGIATAIASSIAQVLQYLKPLSYLRKESSEAQLYGVGQLRRFPPHGTKQRRFMRAGHDTEIHLTTTCSMSVLRDKLSKAYDILLNGCKIEFHVRPLPKDKKHTLDWALKNALHLRPETIMAAMPAGTKQVVDPVRHEIEMIMVLEPSDDLGSLNDDYSTKFSGGRLLKRPSHIRDDNHLDMEGSTSSDSVHSHESAPRILQYSPFRSNPNEICFSHSDSETPHEIVTGLSHNIVPFESSKELRATISSQPEDLVETRTESMQRSIPAPRKRDIEGSGHSHTMRSRGMMLVLDRTNMSHQYSVKSFKPEETLETFICRTWKKKEFNP